MPKTFPVTCHTDFVGLGSTFIAITGYVQDGVTYIQQAIAQGAHTIVIENSVELAPTIYDTIAQSNGAVLRVANTQKALADFSAQAAGFPAQKLKIIGITGTKGKTTTAFLLAHCLRTAGYKTALLSSAGNYIEDSFFAASLTTPQADYLHQFLRLCVNNNIEYVVMEVAAQALTLHRVHGIQFDGIIFTNFSHEHLEFYATLDDYFAAKCHIFSMAKETACILINTDDEWVKYLPNTYQNSIKTYSFIDKTATYVGTYKDYMQSAIVLLQTEHNEIVLTCPTLFGLYNGYNIVAAATMALQCGIKKETITHAIKTFSGVTGRLQRIILPNGACAFIDYAHNPSSFHAVLSTLRSLTNNLIVIFGAGGGKDKHKRPIMGSIACMFADTVILTSDNPRLENLDDIIQDICRGISDQDKHKIIVQQDRTTAIQKAYELSRSESIIALLGKGPDEYQIIGTEKHFFSEKAILQQLNVIRRCN
jgi:UDP-N-acetylmuramoyl-L-alanyl-D-glutamate--2,6-diaminopimelate ligase